MTDQTIKKAKQKNTEVQDQEANSIDPRITDLEQQVETQTRNYHRALADYQNLERRTQEDKSDLIKFANKNLLNNILPGIDQLLMAQGHIKDQGLDMVVDNFKKLLEDEGLKEIKTEGQDFDPTTMECLEIVEGPDQKVITTLQKGYTLYGDVLRPAKVTVGKSK